MNKRTKRLLAMISGGPKLCKVSGLPPLTYTAKKTGELKNYRIFGNTVSGESTGDRTGNLFDKTAVKNSTGINRHTGEEYLNGALTSSDYISVKPNTEYTNNSSFMSTSNAGIAFYDTNKQYLSGIQAGESTANIPYTYTTPNTAAYMRITIYTYTGDAGYISIDNFSVNEGSTALPYEPYGYRVPVKVEGKNLLDANNITIGKAWNGDNNSNRAVCYVKCQPNSNYSITLFDKSVIEDMYVFRKAEKDSTTTTDPNLRLVTTLTFSTSENTNYIVVQYNKTAITHDDCIGVKLSVVQNTEPPEIYEPYHAPVVTDIYLPEPLRMVDTEADYIDYREQKEFFADGTSADVTLPALPTIAGTNTLSVETDVQPSMVEIEGRIKPVDTGGGD